jgi:tRNA U34 5-carboxymethylaminomethyl modifying GTPase MnmE/TrmE
MDLEKKAMEKIFQLADKEIEKEMNKPFQVAIMGQTGVGKSSLLNALFNANLKTDAVKPCTKEEEKVPAKFDNTTVWFYDLPGIGESGEADEKYLSNYREKILKSDVVLWAFHADNRSVTFDLNSLNKLLQGMDEDHKHSLISKITFVLTKCDLINLKPWMLAKNGKDALFFPDKYVEQILNEKISYYSEVFSYYLRSKNHVTTFNDCNFNLKLAGFEINENKIKVDGILTLEQLKTLSSEYPQFAKVFERLSIKNKIIPCSSYLNYNLPRLLLAIADKIQGESSIRFKKFTDDISNLDRMPYEEAIKKFNFRVLDIDREKTLFDANQNIFNL